MSVPVRTYVRPQKVFPDFTEIWSIDRDRLVIHDGIPYDPIQGQGQGHVGLKCAVSSANACS